MAGRRRRFLLLRWRRQLPSHTARHVRPPPPRRRLARAGRAGRGGARFEPAGSPYSGGRYALAPACAPLAYPRHVTRWATGRRSGHFGPLRRRPARRHAPVRAAGDGPGGQREGEAGRGGGMSSGGGGGGGRRQRRGRSLKACVCLAEHVLRHHGAALRGAGPRRAGGESGPGGGALQVPGDGR